MKPQRDDLYKKLFTIYQKLKKHINASDICMSLENARKAFITALYLIPENDYNHWKIGLVMHNLGQYDLVVIK
ncbi:UDP-N-acetylglucosamine--peptide N-acetylglucosaminyltransferase 110 kDa subunit-like isoform X1 [Aphis craccivora]|uniref:UDP-N-acetylglucosamine--peptide N-acetylglucosaminyltransferase 110 kDa subunit-like isoform X1 n=1 Tax=Aphis craccivora TaxID=307492 RepID=A0A6G0Y0Y2_APHCR|nr:UDP-N-acetylglucosamine--peptide N-acetylglucosaminyltransferase 110 kDa subunit-like isoform X1 [Aphis craccivora]